VSDSSNGLSTLSQKSETVSLLCDSLTFVRQSDFCETVRLTFLRQCGQAIRDTNDTARGRMTMS